MVRRSLNRRNGEKRRRSMRGGSAEKNIGEFIGKILIPKMKDHFENKVLENFLLTRGEKIADQYLFKGDLIIFKGFDTQTKQEKLFGNNENNIPVHLRSDHIFQKQTLNNSIHVGTANLSYVMGNGGASGSESRWIKNVFDPWANSNTDFKGKINDAGKLRQKMHNQNISEIIKKISEKEIHAVGLQELDGMSIINGKSLQKHVEENEQQLLTYAGIPENVKVCYIVINANDVVKESEVEAETATAEAATEVAVNVGFVFSQYSLKTPRAVTIYTGILFNLEQLEFDKSSENTFFTMDHTIQPGRPLVAIKVKYKEEDSDNDDDGGKEEEDIVLASMHGANLAASGNRGGDYFRNEDSSDTNLVKSNISGQDEAENMHHGIVAQIKQMENKLGKQRKYIIMGDMNDEFPTIKKQVYNKVDDRPPPHTAARRVEGTVTTINDTSHATNHGWPFKSILSILANDKKLANDEGLKYTAIPSDKGTCCLNWNSFRYDLLEPKIFNMEGGKRRKPKRRKTKGKKTKRRKPKGKKTKGRKTKGKKTKRRKTKGRKTSR